MNGCRMFRLGKRVYLRIIKEEFFSIQLEVGLWSFRLGVDGRMSRNYAVWRVRDPWRIGNPAIAELSQVETRPGLFMAVLKFREGFH